MTGKRLAVFFLLIVALELMLVDASPWFWRRRRRRRAAPRPTTPKPSPPTTPTTPKPSPPTTPKPCNNSKPYPNIKWANDWHQSFYAHCPHTYSMSQWISLYRGCQQDRIHHFRCRLGPAFYNSRHCSWTPHVLHDVKHSFFYRCPNNGFITGVISYFNKASKDRRVGLKCCSVNGYKQSYCKTTPYWNSFGGLLNYIVPPGYTMTGVGSDHSVASTATYSDRRWRFEICQVKLSLG